MEINLPVEKEKEVRIERKIKLLSYGKMMSQTMIRTSKELKIGQDGNIIYEEPTIKNIMEADYSIQ